LKMVSVNHIFFILLLVKIYPPKKTAYNST